MAGKSAAIKSAAEFRREAHEQWQRDDVVRALLEERRGYVTRAGLAAERGDDGEHGRLISRVGQVDEQLRARDAEGEIPGDALPKLRRARKAPAAAADDSGDGAGDGAGS